METVKINKKALRISHLPNESITVKDFCHFVFHPEEGQKIEISEVLLQKSQNNYLRLLQLMKEGRPIYGVTTGFGYNATQYVDFEQAEKLQVNLVNYLSCGLGKSLSVVASRAMMLVRLVSLSQGYSAVSQDLLMHLKKMVELDIVPVVPCEGSLGASGDLIPLAYLAQAVQGQGQVFFQNQIFPTQDIFKKCDIMPYKLKPKEGLAIVNGTSTMAGVMTENLNHIENIIKMVMQTTAMHCMVLEGKREAFDVFINEIAKKNPGQKQVAAEVRNYLDQENYFPHRGQDVSIDNKRTKDFVQDRYSLRCVPQIMGPVVDFQKYSLDLLQYELNTVSDNPVLNDEGGLEMGGNFYGGYLAQSMDVSKINLAHVADLIDRQVMMLFDETTNRGLPINLVDVKNIPEAELHTHHGLKGLHQATSAITSEIMQKSIPNSIFSRSSESHNQDKVSLGLSAAVTCGDMIEGVYKILALQLVCLCQALEIKNIKLKSPELLKIYQTVRSCVPKVSADIPLDRQINQLINKIKA